MVAVVELVSVAVVMVLELVLVPLSLQEASCVFQGKRVEVTLKRGE
jgi:hypothetical protein